MIFSFLENIVKFKQFNLVHRDYLMVLWNDFFFSEHLWKFTNMIILLVSEFKVKFLYSLC